MLRFVLEANEFVVYFFSVFTCIDKTFLNTSKRFSIFSASPQYPWKPDYLKETTVHFHKSLRDDASKMAVQENPEIALLKGLCYIVYL